MNPLRIGLYGTNGHQLPAKLDASLPATVVAVAGFAAAAAAKANQDHPVNVYESLAQLLADKSVDLVSLCSPLRADQARDAVLALEAGKHVYAEKPSALTEGDLDRIIQTAKKTGRIFHEQAATAFDQPYTTLRQIVAAGTIGTVVQVFSQKCYPWHDGRPQDRRVDGGLAMQVGIYNLRFVEHVAGVKVKTLTAKRTSLGNPIPGGQADMAVSMVMELANGGLASSVTNYYCPLPGDWGRWGYETVRIWGTMGMVESIDNGRIGTLAVYGRPVVALDFSAPGRSYLGMFLEEIQTGKKVIPFALEDELSPTRWVIRASGS